MHNRMPEDWRTGNTRLCGVVTQGAVYSLSPQVHNEGYAKLDLDFHYLRHDIDPAAFDGFLQGVLANPSYRGLSIGTPHKLAVRQYVEMDDVARQVGAVNTVVIDRAAGVVRARGTNTDWYGIENSITERTGRLEGKSVAVVGASGAGRAAIFAMSRHRLRLKVFNRDDQFLADLRRDQPELDTATLEQTAELENFDVVIHATPMGMKPGQASAIPVEHLRRGQVLLDCVYSAQVPTTRLVAAAEAAGVIAIRGIEMFFWQATRQFELFTGHEPPLDAMRAAIPPSQ